MRHTLYSGVLVSRLGCSEMSTCNFMLISPYKCHDRQPLESEKKTPVQTPETTRPHAVTSNHLKNTRMSRVDSVPFHYLQSVTQRLGGVAE